MDFQRKPHREFTRCPASGSLVKALNRAVAIAFEEFSIPGDLIPIIGTDCSTIRAQWEEVKGRIQKRGPPSDTRRGHRLRMMLKSTSRLFDAPCAPCDKKASKVARQKWVSKMTIAHPPEKIAEAETLMPLLRSKVRWILSGWGRRLRDSEGEAEPRFGSYVPDVQGCFETQAFEGGTLATELDELVVGRGGLGDLRVGVAKTKGKHRVVTMQRAYVKKVLTPVHNALYDHITSSDWCVRGDVTLGDFRAVKASRKEGESFISGDYEAASDNILQCVAKLIAEEMTNCPELSEEQKRVLSGSFEDPGFYELREDGLVRVPILKGSMMGNLCGFPLLCILNFACYQIARDLSGFKPWTGVGRFNGDDCLFCGDLRLYQRWREVTGLFGLIVNEEKTGFSARWLDLNSQTFDARKDSRVHKPVISFLRPEKNCLGEILTGIIEGVRSFKRPLQKKIVCVYMRYEICLRGVKPAVANLPKVWQTFLLKQAWFRKALFAEDPPTRSQGVDREVPVVKGPPPLPCYYDAVVNATAHCTQARISFWSGQNIALTRKRQLYGDTIPSCSGPYRSWIDRPNLKAWKKELARPPPPGRIVVNRVWEFLYPAIVWDRYFKGRPDRLVRSDDKWIDDSPLLSVGSVVRRRKEQHNYPQPSCLNYLQQYPLGYR